MSVFTFGRNAPQDQGPQIPPEDVNDANEGPNQKSNKRLSLPLGWMKYAWKQDL